MDQELKSIFDKYRDAQGSTIVVLQEIQNKYRYLTQEALEAFSQYFSVPLSEIYGVATFYSQFKFHKPGRFEIKVCHGTACHINGAVAVTEALESSTGIKAGETDSEGKFSLEKVACLGCCSLAPVVMINDQVFGKLEEKKIKKIIKEY